MCFDDGKTVALPVFHISKFLPVRLHNAYTVSKQFDPTTVVKYALGMYYIL
jgi:hypothetical protein